MIIRINGVAINEPQKDLSEPKSVSVSQAVVKKFFPFGHRAVFAAALATLFMDMMFGSGATTAMAASPTSLTGAFEPVKRLLIDLADPLCYVMFVWGCIEAIVGRPASGLNRMKYASIGYIGINWIPVVMGAIRAAAP